jgi:hypothetical protein
MMIKMREVSAAGSSHTISPISHPANIARTETNQNAWPVWAWLVQPGAHRRKRRWKNGA